MRRQRSLRTRLVMIVTTLVAVCTAGTSLLAYVLETSGSKDRFVDASVASARSDFRSAGRAAAAVPRPEQPRTIVDVLRQRPGVSWRIFARFTVAGTSFWGNVCRADHPVPGEGSTYDPALPLRHTWISLCNGQDYLAVYGSPVAGVSLTEFFDFGPARRQLEHLRTVLIWVSLGGLALAGGVGMVVGRRVAAPVQQAADAARRMGDDLSVRVPVDPEQAFAELAELSQALNDSAAKIERSQAQQRRFVADVAHELRTPLAAMLAAAQSMSSRDPTRRARAEQLLTGQTRRLSTMVDDLLEISRFDAGQAVLELEEVDLVDLTQDAVQSLALGERVDVASAGDPVARVDPRRVHLIVRNLLNNAVQHGAPPISVLVDGTGADVLVTVTDGGAGVAPGLAGTVFDRFVRGDAGRTTDDRAGGTGLGLAIAQENAALHGGAITLCPAGRTTFTLRLPRRSHPRVVGSGPGWSRTADHSGA